MIIADTSGLLALYNDREPTHERVRDVVASAPDALVVSPYVVGELDCLVATRMGVDIELKVVRDLASGAFELPLMAPSDLAACADVVERYRDQGIGVTDASLVVLAKRFDTRRILTLDHRHFEVVRPIGGGRFTLLPGRR